MDSLTVSSSLVSPFSKEAHLSPAMVTALWVIGDELDRKRIDFNKVKDGLWLRIPSSRLRGDDARNDNVWLRQCLKRLTGLEIEGDYRGDPWGAVILAEWHIREGGSVVDLLLPPAAVRAIKSPSTFAKIETYAAYKLTGAAKLLYAALADKKRMKEKYWVYDLDELRQLLGVAGKYPRWNSLRQCVLDPSLEQINDYGTVQVKMTPQKLGRSIVSVRFDWEWKSLDDARVTDEENEKHPTARHKPESDGSAPPLTKPEDELRKRAYEFWCEQNNIHDPHAMGVFRTFLDWYKPKTSEEVERLLKSSIKLE